MSPQGPTILIDHCSLEDIRRLLLECDDSFIPRLSETVNIEQYALKLRGLARTIEAWSDRALIGLVAGYIDDETKCAFISSVCVAPTATRLGIATKLMGGFVRCADSAGMWKIELDVSPRATAAIRLYERIGFVLSEQKDDALRMRLRLNEF